MYSWEIESLIDETEGEIDACRDSINDLQSELYEVQQVITLLESRLQSKIEEVIQEKNSIEQIVSQHRQSRIDSTSDWASVGAAEIEQAYDEAHSFALYQLSRINSALNEHDSSTNFQSPSSNFGFAGNFPSVDGENFKFGQVTAGADDSTEIANFYSEAVNANEAQDSLINQTLVFTYIGGQIELLMPQALDGISQTLETTYDYEVGDKSGSVPYRVYRIPKEAWNKEDYTAESFAVNVAVSKLIAEGRQAIVILGGPGKPDIISVDANNKLCFTEVKGSYSGRHLANSGLLRTVKDETEDPLLGETKVWENSPEWLRRSGVDVLRNLKDMQDKNDDPNTKSQLQELYLLYSDAVANGFEKDNHLTEIYQVGNLDDGDELPYLEANATLHAYCAEVEPESITQISTE